MRERGPLALPAFRRFWIAATVSDFGSYVTLVAIQVIVVVTLDGSATEVGLVNAARWLPYLLLGLVAGVLVDRYRRKPVLVSADLGRGVLLGAIPLLALLDALSVPALMAIMTAFGTLALAGDAATQAFLPRVVPPELVTPANARLDQSDAAAQTTGPAVGGALVSALTAPVAVLVDAVSFLVSGLAMASIRITEPDPAPPAQRHFRRELGEGLRWVYRHRTLAPFAICTHVWFLFFTLFTTVTAPFLLLELDISPLGLGLVLAAAGVGALLGSSLSARLGARFGVGRVTVASWVGNAAGIAVVAIAPDGVTGAVVVGAGQFVLGVSMGTENANTLGYRQAVTPDALQGRTNTTMRSVNRAMVVISAPLGGLLADTIGFRPVLGIAAAGLVLTAVALAATPFRSARLGSLGEVASP